MPHYAGLEVALEETSICPVDESGNPVWQGKASSKPRSTGKAIANKVTEAIEIRFETSPLSTRHQPNTSP